MTSTNIPAPATVGQHVTGRDVVTYLKVAGTVTAVDVSETFKGGAPREYRVTIATDRGRSYILAAGTVKVTPIHQLPTSCHVCGSPVPNREGATRPDCWHNFTNAEALAEAREHDRRVVAAGGPVYSTGARSAEAAYVDATRGR